MYHYFAHGLRIASEFACPELAPATFADLAADVIICLGQTPAALEDPVKAGGFYQAKPNQFLLALDQIQIARFWVQDGNRITIEPAPGSDEDTIRLFLLGSALGALLHQRGQIILHGSAVETERGAVIFVGPSGVGKSTLAAALQQKGYRVLADDVSSIVYDEAAREAQVHPGLAHLKLWADAAEQLDLSAVATRRVRPELEKYALPLSNPFAQAPVRLCAVYILSDSNLGEWRIESVAQLQKVEMLVANTYRQRFLVGLGMRQQHFQQITRIASQVRVYRVTRPAIGFCIAELCERLIAEWGKA
jgi:hypothetical protein